MSWIEVRDVEVAGERNRALYMLKSRGMSHSNQVRELLISSTGVTLADVFAGPDGVLIGSAKASEKQKRAREEHLAREDAARSERMLELKRQALDAQIATLRAEYAAHEEEVRRRARAVQESAEAARSDRESISQMRTEAGRAPATNGGGV